MGIISTAMSAIDIFTGGLNGLMFAGSNKMSITVKQDKRITEFEVENGESRNDHVVFEPVKISIDFVVSDLLSKGSMIGFQNAFKNNEIMTISTALGVYDNMMIESMPRHESSEIMLGAFLTIDFKEYREVQAEYGEMSEMSVADPSNSNTVDRGTVRGSSTPSVEPPKSGSVAVQLQDGITNWVSGRGTTQ